MWTPQSRAPALPLSRGSTELGRGSTFPRSAPQRPLRGRASSDHCLPVSPPPPRSRQRSLPGPLRTTALGVGTLQALPC